MVAQLQLRVKFHPTEFQGKYLFTKSSGEYIIDYR